jgi:hypothetical protein
MIKLVKHDNHARVNSLDIPWQAVDIISSNCPKHAGVRLARLGDQIFQCPFGHEIYKTHGSLTNQTNRDNYYLGVVVKN